MNNLFNSNLISAFIKNHGADDKCYSITYAMPNERIRFKQNGNTYELRIIGLYAKQTIEMQGYTLNCVCMQIMPKNSRIPPHGLFMEINSLPPNAMLELINFIHEQNANDKLANSLLSQIEARGLTFYTNRVNNKFAYIVVSDTEYDLLKKLHISADYPITTFERENKLKELFEKCTALSIIKSFMIENYGENKEYYPTFTKE